MSETGYTLKCKDNEGGLFEHGYSLSRNEIESTLLYRPDSISGLFWAFSIT